MQTPPDFSSNKEGLLRLMPALRRGLLAGAILLLAPAFVAPAAATGLDRSGLVETAAGKQTAKPKAGTGTKKKADATKAGGKKGDGKKAAAKKEKAEDQKPGPLADFGKEDAPPDVVHVANWVSYTRNHKNKAFVLIDKKNAQLYVFDPKGKLKSSTPILLGKAIGDHTVPGIGNKPMSQIKEHEKTTPAGRFLAEPGKNNRGEDIIWIDYESSVSMHRLRKVSAAERRAERMATPDPSDNRISYGCVNVPPKFYNTVLKPKVMKYGAFVYVLPETKPPQQVFASYDVPPKKDKGVQVAEASGSSGGKAGK
jgi:lipoprotein-anchoring transpeptidase ErfK/SrfK